MTEIFFVKKFPGNAYRYIDKEFSLCKLAFDYVDGNVDGETILKPTLFTAPMFKNGCIDHEQWGEVESPEPIFKEICLNNYSRYPYD
tara:strand:+ start:359 stop:619 length:261 start_codon:yes stop_codon:yes gene_type:complete